MVNELVNRLLLWHCTSRENAEAISREGFRLGPQRWWHRAKVVFFFHSVSHFLDMITEVDRTQCEGFFCAVDLDGYALGHEYVHDMGDVFAFHVPLSKDVIITRFNIANIRNQADLRHTLSEQLQCDISQAFSSLCLDEAIPWNQLTAIASTLRALDEETYHNTRVTQRLIREEIRGIDDNECEHLFSLLVEGNERFHRRFLDLYYGTYAFPHLARALMVAGARFVHPVQIVALHDSSVAIHDRSKSRKRRDDASVAGLLAEFLPKLERKEVVFGAIEMAAMQKFPGDEADLEVIEKWLTQQGSLAEEAALHFIRFGYASSPPRRGERAVRMAVAALRGTGRDCFEVLSPLTDTDYPATHFGLMQAFGLLRERRAIPYLLPYLKDERNQIRASTVQALGRIGTVEAIDLVKQVANDKAKAVRRATQSVLERSP